VVVDEEAAKERFIALEQFLQGIDEQALAKAARAGEEIGPRLPGQFPGMRSFVHITHAVGKDLLQAIDTDGKRLE